MKVDVKNGTTSTQKGQLPAGWFWRALDDLGVVRLGKTPRKTDYRSSGLHKIVKFRDVKVNGQIDWNKEDKGFVDSSKETLGTLKELEEGDVLVTASAHMSEHIGKKVGIISNIPAKYNTAYVVGEILQIRTNEAADPKWILYYLQSDNGYKEIQKQVHGVHLIASRAKEIRIPLAPLEDQKKIGAEIEKQFSRLDKAVTSLKRAKANLKRYKAAVLKSAVEGKLTEEWRKQHPAIELASADIKGNNYSPPLDLITSDLPVLPNGWLWVPLDLLLVEIKAGKSFKCEERPPLFPKVGVVKVSAVTWGKYNDLESKTCLDSDRISSGLIIRKGDFLFSRANTIDLVGACVIAEYVTREVMLSDKILRLRFIKDDLKTWILQVLRSNIGRYEIERLATGNQESMRNIGQKRIRAIRIPLPPEAEMQIIMQEIEKKLSQASILEDIINSKIARALKLKGLILKIAYSGALIN